jgi:FkbM family methyltransferase
MQLTAMMRSFKARTINTGLYRPARFVFDHFFERSRLRNHNRRVSLLKKIISPGDLCFDVGANIGDYTASLIAAGARVVAVEPQASCLQELSARFARDHRVVLVPCALGAKEQTAKFYVRKYHETSGLVQDWENSETNECLEIIDVPVKTLESLFKTYGIPRYIKIDVEGYEIEVISGIQTKVDMLSFEYFLTEDNYTSKMKIIKMLEHFGSLRLNILPEGAPSFIWNQFVPFDKFRDELYRKLHAPRGEPRFGDIFVRIG